MLIFISDVYLYIDNKFMAFLIIGKNLAVFISFNCMQVSVYTM